jgi:4-amino-4-deoxy-L-arabinose transferase-like glycosyltransferase
MSPSVYSTTANWADAHARSTGRPIPLRFAGVLVVSLLLLTINLGTSPPVWFDEGHKMNAGRTLAETGVYGTYTVNGYRLFDPQISCGPADVVPMALSFRLFGLGVTQARAVFVAYTLLAVVALYSLAALMFGARAGAFAVLIAVLAPSIGGVSLVAIGRQVLGETAALALVLCGVLLWFSRWESLTPPRAIAAGLLLGVGLLSKNQVVFALLPALAIVVLAREWAMPRRLLSSGLPIVVMLGVVLGWSLLGSVVTDPVTRGENSELLVDTIRSNLWTGLWGRTLSRGALVIAGIMALAVAVSAARLWRRRAGQCRDNAWWLEAFLALFVGVQAVWFTLFSVGWPRYAHAGLVVAMVMLGGAAGNWLYASAARSRTAPRLAWLLSAVLVMAHITGNSAGTRYNDAEATAAFIDGTVPPDAIIETWEWELSALSRHRRFHHPDQGYLYKAIRQFSHAGEPFSLAYNPLKAEPDYLIIGPFGAWTELYSTSAVAGTFEPVADIGRYRVLKRR